MAERGAIPPLVKIIEEVDHPWSIREGVWEIIVVHLESVVYIELISSITEL